MIAVLLLVAGALLQPAEAADELVIRTPAEIAAIQARLVGELMSPYCAGLTLENCPTSGAAAMREQIGLWLQEGHTETWILDTLVAEWGEAILGAPRFRGLGMVAWLAPAVVLAVTTLGLVTWLRRQGRPGPAPAPVAPAAEALRRRVEEEIARLDD